MLTALWQAQGKLRRRGNAEVAEKILINLLVNKSILDTILQEAGKITRTDTGQPNQTGVLFFRLGIASAAKQSHTLL